MLAVLEGALMIAHCQRDAESFNSIVQTLEAMLKPGPENAEKYLGDVFFLILSKVAVFFTSAYNWATVGGHHGLWTVWVEELSLRPASHFVAW